MKKVILYLVLAIGVMAVINSFLIGQVSAAGCSLTILPNSWCSNNENGEGIWRLLALVLQILTYGVGILATIGIVWAGIMYTTAGDSVEKTTKAKNRIFEIVLGLIAYAVIVIVAQFLIPGGVF